MKGHSCYKLFHLKEPFTTLLTTLKRVSPAVVKTSILPTVFSEHQDCILVRVQFRDHVTACKELAQQRQLVSVNATVCTVRPKALDNGLMEIMERKKLSFSETSFYIISHLIFL